ASVDHLDRFDLRWQVIRNRSGPLGQDLAESRRVHLARAVHPLADAAFEITSIGHSKSSLAARPKAHAPRRAAGEVDDSRRRGGASPLPPHGDRAWAGRLKVTRDGRAM